jgi:hypothetical protein
VIAVAVVPVVLVLLGFLVMRARRRGKARSADSGDGFAPWAVLTLAEGRVRHRAVPSRRLFRGSGGAM